jgi:ATP-dependent DNA helicase RecG
MLYVKEKGKITNSEYQTLNEREKVTRDLKELIDKLLIKPSGQKGAGAFYTLN